MFEKLFKYPAVLSRHLNAPFAKERADYLAHRARDGTAKETLLRIARELLVIIQEIDFCTEDLIDIKVIDAVAKRWAQKQKCRNKAHGLHHSRRMFFQIARDWLRFIRRLKEPEVKPGSFTPMIQQF